MKTVRKIALFISIGILFATCKKESLPPSSVTNQPVFSFNGNMGGTPLNIQAGVNNYYMYSSYTQNSGVYSFTGNLQSTVYKYNSIQITINDDMVEPANAASDITNSVAVPNTYYYAIPGGPSVEDSVEFIPKIGSGTATSFTYTFGDGGSITSNNKAPVWHVYKTFQRYGTQLGVAFRNAGLVTVSDSLNLARQSAIPPIIDSIHATVGLDSLNPLQDSVKFTATISGGTPPYTYKWQFGDGSSTSSQAQPVHIYSNPSHLYTDTLTVTDSKGLISAIYKYTITEASDSSLNYVNYAILQPIHVPNPYSLSTVTVNYTDPKGNQYTSNNSSQSTASAFQITSVQGYQANTNGNPTKMLKITFNCMLYNTALHDSIAATNCTAVIAVAYH